MFSSTEAKKEEGEQSSTVSSAVNAVQSYADDISNRTSKLLGLGPKSTIEQLEDDLCACCPTLTYGQRIAGYCICVFVSFCLTIGAATRLGELLAGDPAPFAIFYTFQNVVCVCSSFFLSGPAAQCKKMCDATRFVLIDSVPSDDASFKFCVIRLSCVNTGSHNGLPAFNRCHAVLRLLLRAARWRTHRSYHSLYFHSMDCTPLVHALLHPIRV